MEKSELNISKVLLALFYLFLSCLIILLRRNSIFYIDYIPHDFNLDRFLWSLSSTIFIFSVLAFHFRNHPINPFLGYVTYYPFILVMMASLVFSRLHIFEETSGFVFYLFLYALY